MTPQEQSTVLEAREILSRYLNHNPVISTWQLLLDYCHMTICQSPIEEFHILFLDSKNQLLEDTLIARGTVNHVPVYPREVIKRGLEVNAAAMILVHNHPSGDPTPSRDDIEMTQKIRDATEFVAITVHDHIIVGANTEFSFRAGGLLT